MASDDDLFASDDEEQPEEEEQEQPPAAPRSEVASARQTEDGDGGADDDLFGSEDEQDMHTTSRKRQRKMRPAETRSTYLMDLPDPSTVKVVKLSNMLNFEQKPFDPSTYEVGPDQIVDHDGTKRFNLHHLNTVRWRWTTNEFGERVPESNARFVQWEDGSTTLMIGDEALSVAEVQEQASRRYLFVRGDGVTQPLAPLGSRLQLHPASLQSKLHRALQLLSAKGFVRDTRKVQATAATVDVRKAAEEQALMVQQMKDARAQLRAKKARQRKRYGRSSGGFGVRAAAPVPRFNEGFLEGDDEGDEGYEEEFDAGMARADLQRNRRPYDPEAEEAAEQRLRAAQNRGPSVKRSRIDDDDDEELSDFIASSGEEDNAPRKTPPSAPKQPVRRGAAIMDSDDDD